jgi:hypothetical protein
LPISIGTLDIIGNQFLKLQINQHYYLDFSDGQASRRRGNPLCMEPLQNLNKICLSWIIQMPKQKSTATTKN